MTIAKTSSSISYEGNGSTTAFAYPYRFFDDTDLKVYLIDSSDNSTLKTLTTDYSIVNAGDETGGTVTMVTAPAINETLLIEREVPQTQGTDYQANDPFPAEAHEAALDRLTLMSQDKSSNDSRHLAFPVGDTTDPELPTRGDRQFKLLGFGNKGVIELYNTETGVITTIFDTISDLRASTVPFVTGTYAEIRAGNAVVQITAAGAGDEDNDAGTWGYTVVVPPRFDTVDDLLTDGTSVSNFWPSGTTVTVEKEGFSYQVAASGASDHHLTTAGGVKLYVSPGNDGKYNAEAFNNIGDDSTVNTTAMATAFNASATDGIPLIIPEGTFLTGALGAIPSGLHLIGSGRIKVSGTDITLCEPAGDVFVEGVEFEGFMKGFDFDNVAANSLIKFTGVTVIDCGTITTAGGRVDFQGFIHAGTAANAIKSLVVDGCTIEGDDFGICYRSGFDLARVINSTFRNMRRMGLMLGWDNSGDWTPFKRIVVDNNDFFEIVGDDADEHEIHAALVYGDFAQVANNRVDECRDIHASTHNSEAIYVRANKGHVFGNEVENGGRGDGCISVKGGDKTIVSGNTVEVEASWASTYGTPTGLYLDGVDNKGRVNAFGNNLFGTLNRAILTSGGGKVHGNHIEGTFTYGLFGILDSSTGAAGGDVEFNFEDNTIIQEGSGSAAMIVRVEDGYTVNYAGFKNNSVRLGPSGDFSGGGQSFVQLEPYQVSSGDRNTIAHADVQGNTFLGRSGENPTGCLCGTNSGSGGTGGLITRVTFKANDSDYGGNTLRMSTVSSGDVDTFYFFGGLHTNINGRLLSNPTNATTGYCQAVRGSRPSEVSGTTTITSGNTSRTVTMGLQDTLRPTSLDNISVSLNSSLGSASEWWVDNLTGDTFDINVDSNPGTTVNFSWEARNEYYY